MLNKIVRDACLALVLVSGTLTSTAASAIIGGRPSFDPASVMLIMEQSRVATGTWVGNRTLLVAGHSVRTTDPKDILVYQLAKEGDVYRFVEHKVKAKLVHPTYVKLNGQDRKTDMAFLLLADGPELQGEPHQVSTAPLKRGIPLEMAGYGAGEWEGKALLRQHAGVNVIPARDGETEEAQLAYLKSRIWERQGIMRIFGRMDANPAAGEPGTNVSPAGGDSGMGIRQDGVVRAVFSGTSLDIEVGGIGISAAPLSLAENRAFLEEAQEKGFAFLTAASDVFADPAGAERMTYGE